jgi:hypothetical protein
LKNKKKKGSNITSDPEIRVRKKQRQEEFKDLLDRSMRDIFSRGPSNISMQEKVRHVLEWGRECAREVKLSDDFIANSMDTSHQFQMSPERFKKIKK